MKKARPALVLLLAMAMATATQAQTLPQFDLQGGTPVAYRSQQADARDLSINAMLYKPDMPAKGVVVIVNGSSSPRDYREGQYGRALSSAGYAVLAIDTFGSRGIVDTGADQAQLGTEAQAHDVLAARKYLVSLGYAADRTAVMGSGRGGTIALMVADRTFVQDEKDRFVAAMAIGATCMFHPRLPKPASRVFVAVGEKDEVAGVQPCKDFAKEFAAAGGRIETKVYPGAANSFDGNPGNLRMFRDPFVQSFADCRVSVEPDGRSTYNGKAFAESDTTGLAAEMRKSCIKRGGFSWTNLTQKATVTLDVIEFLDLNFRR
jgi:dienelactone hydrolase